MKFCHGRRVRGLLCSAESEEVIRWPKACLAGHHEL